MCRAILISIGILFIWAVVGVVSTVLQIPDVVSIVIPLLATSIWAGFDARKIEFKKYKTSLGSTVYGGGGVFAAVLLLWIIFFPWYLFSRGKILSGKAKLRDEYEGEAQLRDKYKAEVEPVPISEPTDYSNNLSQIEKLAELKTKGILTEEEFQTQKKKLLPR